MAPRSQPQEPTTVPQEVAYLAPSCCSWSTWWTCWLVSILRYSQHDPNPTCSSNRPQAYRPAGCHRQRRALSLRRLLTALSRVLSRALFSGLSRGLLWALSRTLVGGPGRARPYCPAHRHLVSAPGSPKTLHRSPNFYKTLPQPYHTQQGIGVKRERFGFSGSFWES